MSKLQAKLEQIQIKVHDAAYCLTLADKAILFHQYIQQLSLSPSELDRC